jgi:hypothetical protein
VTEHEGPPRLHPVHVPLSFRVLDVGAVASPDEERLTATNRFPRAHGRVDASRNGRPRTLP